MQLEQPTPLQQLGLQASLLSPGKRLALGGLLLLTGGLLFFDLRAVVLPELPWAVLLLGAAVTGSAVQALRRQRRLEREFADALARWDVLAAGVAAAEASGQSAVRYLQQQGIGRYEVRRFVLQQVRGCDAPPSRPVPRPPIGFAAADDALPGNLQHDGRGGRPRAEPPPGPRWLSH